MISPQTAQVVLWGFSVYVNVILEIDWLKGLLAEGWRLVSCTICTFILTILLMIYFLSSAHDRWLLFDTFIRLFLIDDDQSCFQLIILMIVIVARQ